MKKTIIYALMLLCSFSLSAFTQTPKKSATQVEVKEIKLTSEQKLEIMSKYIVLNEKEKSDILIIFNNAKNEKDKIKAADFAKKIEKEKIKAVKTNQKEKLRKILGAKRYGQYEKLKDKNIL